jgi:hypothetical protein
MVQYNKLTSFIKRINQLEISDPKNDEGNKGPTEDIIPKLPESVENCELEMADG